MARIARVVAAGRPHHVTQRGKRRFPDGTDDPTGSITSEATSGFTGHEMIDAVGLVNMNGRIYDPQIGRFLSADPFIHEITNTQDLNRYSYVHNNPLSVTDMDGYGFFKKFWRVLVAIVVAVVLWYVAPVIFGSLGVSGFTTGVAAGAPGYAAIANGVGMNAGTAALSAGVAGAAAGAVTGGGKGALIGGFTGAAFSGVGSFVGASGATGASKVALSVGLHGVVGGVSSVAGGGKFLSGFLAAGISELAGPLELNGKGFGEVAFNTAEHALLGGFGSVLGGGKFANGAVTGAFGYIFNDLAHDWANAGAGIFGTIGFGAGVAGAVVCDGMTALTCAILNGTIISGSTAIGSGIGYAGGYAAGTTFDWLKNGGWVLTNDANKPPPGSVPIDETPWSGNHGEIKSDIGAGPKTNVKISPDGNVWPENPDGSWTNHGSAGDCSGSGKPKGRRGKDRDR